MAPVRLALVALALGVLGACSPRSTTQESNHHVVAGAGGSPSARPPRAGEDAAPAVVREAAQRPAPNVKTGKLAPPGGSASGGGNADPGPPVEMVTIHVLVEPPQRAHVIWGAKDYGLGPLDIRRPRGSGPLDLLIRAPGYLTLHTRAFTERNSTLSVHLVPEAEAARFPGYQPPAPTVTSRLPTAARHQVPGRVPHSPKPSSAPVPRGDVVSDGAGAP